MQIRILAFGIAKDILRGSTHDLEVEENSTVGEIKKLLYRQHPDLEKLASLRFAVNSEYADETLALSARDELVLIPPVSGG